MAWRAEAIGNREKARDEALWWKVAYICWQNAAAHSWKKFNRKVEDYNPMVKTAAKMTEGERIGGLKKAARTMPKTWAEFKAIDNARR